MIPFLIMRLASFEEDRQSIRFNFTMYQFTYKVGLGKFTFYSQLRYQFLNDIHVGYL